ncbi:MAG: hypothetical protein KAI24_15940 [Planctomycetes bacterium]|nr:hypothetical protein [Planctomycetota bacterium]
MKRKPSTQNNVIRRDNVRVVAQPAMLDCGTVTEGGPAVPMAVVPLLDGDRVAGFEVRCGCGASAVVECVYEDTPPEEAQ